MFKKKKIKKEKKHKCIKIFHRNSILFFDQFRNRNYTREKKNKPYFYLEIIITATKVKHTNDVIRNWRTTRSCFLFFFFLLPPVISKKQWTVNYRSRWKLLTYISIDAYPSPLQGGILNWTKGPASSIRIYTEWSKVSKTFV